MVRRLHPHGYEPLLTAGNHRPMDRPNLAPRTQWRSLSVYIVFFLTSSAMVLMYCIFSMQDPVDNIRTSTGAQISIPGDSKEHTIPTLLSVVHAETGKYIYALNNPLYERLKTIEFHTSSLTGRRGSEQLKDVVSAELPQLSLDNSILRIRDPVTLSWTLGQDSKGRPLVKDDDVMCLYCPASQQDPHEFLEAATVAQMRATSAKHRKDGAAPSQEWHIPSFPVLRYDSCQFRLYKNMTQQLHLLAESPVLETPDSKRSPTGLHLAWTNATSEVLIHFTTGETGTPVAMYGIHGTTTKVQGTSKTYTAQDMCEEPANLTEAGKFQSPGMLHVVKMTELAANTTYQYKVGLASGQGITWSEVHSFRTAPLVGDERPFSYIFYGDQGCPSVGWGDGGLWTAAMVARELDSNETLPITQVHHLGDLSYARGASHIWDEWFNMISTFAARVPLMVGVGNHEYDHTEGGENGKDPSGLNASHGFMPSWGNFYNDSGGECGVPTSQRFNMPATGNGVFWYSYDYASVHTIMLSSEHDMSEGSPQYEWLEAELEAVNRTLTPWLVVEMHRPMYHSERFWNQNLVAMGLRYEIEDLLYKHKVDMVLAGHYHSYLRTCDGLYQSKCDNGGPAYISVGTAGAQLDEGTLYEQDWTKAFRHEEFGYGRITVVNRTALLFEFVKAGAEDDHEAGAVRDDVWIIRDR